MASIPDPQSTVPPYRAGGEDEHDKPGDHPQVEPPRDDPPSDPNRPAPAPQDPPPDEPPCRVGAPAR